MSVTLDGVVCAVSRLLALLHGRKENKDDSSTAGLLQRLYSGGDQALCTAIQVLASPAILKCTAGTLSAMSCISIVRTMHASASICMANDYLADLLSTLGHSATSRISAQPGLQRLLNEVRELLTPDLDKRLKDTRDATLRLRGSYLAVCYEIDICQSRILQNDITTWTSMLRQASHERSVGVSSD
jgi:hypothetical protein